MMPRPLLLETFGVSYRKVPILAIGREVYCDTSLIIEALEYYFPSPAYGTVYLSHHRGTIDRSHAALRLSGPTSRYSEPLRV